MTSGQTQRVAAWYAAWLNHGPDRPGSRQQLAAQLRLIRKYGGDARRFSAQLTWVGSYPVKEGKR